MEPDEFGCTIDAAAPVIAFKAPRRRRHQCDL
jgi:hypothetical protein